MLIGDLGSTPTLQKSPTVSQGHSDFPLHRRTVVLAAILKNAGWAALPGRVEKPPVSTQQVSAPGAVPLGKNS